MITSILPIVVNGLVFACFLYLIGIGLTLQFSVLNFVNFSHAVFFVISGSIAVSLTEMFGNSLIIGSEIIPYVIVSLISLAIMLLLGYIIERALLSNYLYKLSFDHQMLATYGILMMGLAIISFVWGSSGKGIPGNLAPSTILGSVSFAGSNFSIFDIATVMITGLIIVTLHLLFDQTSLGKVAHSVAQDEEMARMLGVDISRIQSIVFAVSMGTVSLAGILFVGSGTISPRMSVDFVLLGYIVAVIGGISSMRGAIIGSIVLGITRSLSIFYIPDIELAVAFALMAIVVLIRPNGLIQTEGIR